MGVLVGRGVLVGVLVPAGVGVDVAVGAKVVWLKRKEHVSSGLLPACPVTWIVMFGLKLVTTMLNSEAPSLKVVNAGCGT